MVKINVAFQLCVCWRISENVGTSKFHTLMDPNSCKWVGNCLRDFCSLFFILAVPIFHAICSIWELEPSIVQAICSIWSWNLPFYMLFAAFDSWNCPFRMLFAAYWSWNLPSGNAICKLLSVFGGCLLVVGCLFCYVCCNCSCSCCNFCSCSYSCCNSSFLLLLLLLLWLLLVKPRSP